MKLLCQFGAAMSHGSQPERLICHRFWQSQHACSSTPNEMVYLGSCVILEVPFELKIDSEFESS